MEAKKKQKSSVETKSKNRLLFRQIRIFFLTKHNRQQHHVPYHRPQHHIKNYAHSSRIFPFSKMTSSHAKGFCLSNDFSSSRLAHRASCIIIFAVPMLCETVWRTMLQCIHSLHIILLYFHSILIRFFIFFVSDTVFYCLAPVEWKWERLICFWYSFFVFALYSLLLFCTSCISVFL